MKLKKLIALALALLTAMALTVAFFADADCSASKNPADHVFSATDTAVEGYSVQKCEKCGALYLSADDFDMEAAYTSVALVCGEKVVGFLAVNVYPGEKCEAKLPAFNGYTPKTPNANFTFPEKLSDMENLSVEYSDTTALGSVIASPQTWVLVGVTAAIILGVTLSAVISRRRPAGDKTEK